VKSECMSIAQQGIESNCTTALGSVCG
jgi:hypothetical protein